MQDVFDPSMNDCVPGIIASLATDNDVRPRREHIDNLALALIAPLHANQYCVRHVNRKWAKIFPTHPSGHSRDLPTDNRLAESSRNKFCYPAVSVFLRLELAGRSMIP